MSALRHKMKEHKKHGGAHHMKRKAGGATNEHEYNAVGAPEMAEAHEKKESFKRGGKKHKKGGKVETEKSMHRPDKKPRRAAGGSVLSSASKKSMASKDESGQGHEGDGPKSEDPDRGCYKSGGAAKWIHGMHMKKGALHRELGVPEGEKIPAKKLERASHSENPKLRKRANLAKTLKHLKG